MLLHEKPGRCACMRRRRVHMHVCRGKDSSSSDSGSSAVILARC